MAGQEGEREPFAAGPVADGLTVHEELAKEARHLGQQHRAAAITPFGDAHHVSWEEGSARLLTALGATSPTTEDNAPGRYRAVDAYCDALEARETGDIEPGS
jgi:hypothetical protein